MVSPDGLFDFVLDAYLLGFLYSFVRARQAQPLCHPRPRAPLRPPASASATPPIRPGRVRQVLQMYSFRSKGG